MAGVRLVYGCKQKFETCVCVCVCQYNRLGSWYKFLLGERVWGSQSKCLTCMRNEMKHCCELIGRQR